MTNGIQSLSPVALKLCPELKVDYIYTYKSVKSNSNCYLDPHK